MRDEAVSRSPKAQVDAWLLVATFALVIIGLIAIYDSSVVSAFRDFGDKLYYFKNQIAWATLGFFALVFFAFFNYRKLLNLGPLLFALSVLSLVLVLIPFIGTQVLGARRWISFGSFTFQPSEFAKLTMIFYATYIMSKFQNHKIRLTDTLVVYFAPILVATALVVIQPDLGTALVFLAIAVIIYFVSQAPIWHFFVSLPFFIIGAAASVIIHPYRLERIKSFLDPNYDPSGASYQIKQIILALSSGGLFGVGLGAARSKFEFIPEVQNDAIFAVIVEEVGFIGAVVLIFVFLFLIYRAIKIAQNAKDFQAKILASGILGLIASQSLLNIASNVALVPLTGVPLPFISYGGSSLFVTLASIGILINIQRNS